MKRASPVMRLSLGLVALTCTILLGLDLAGFLPGEGPVSMESRLAASEVLAAQAAAAAAQRDLGPLRESLQIHMERQPELLSAGLRGVDGRLLLRVGEHRRLWQPEKPRGSTSTHVRVPVMRNGKAWAGLELRFASQAAGGLSAIAKRPLVRLLVAMSVLGFVAYVVFLRRSLRHLDPSAVIPPRVQATLDILTEGVLLLDPDERIVLANASFAERLGRTPDALLGLEASSFDWRSPEVPEAPATAPWIDALSEGRTTTGATLLLPSDQGMRRMVVNASPVRDGWGQPKGVIATFDDVTELQRKTEALESTLSELEKSQDEIRLQNEELELLARRDSLTGVSNRRSFMGLMEKQLEEARAGSQELGLVMADIDHFKLVNDNHGHSAGDEVIRRMAEALSAEVRSSDAVCRYGGEEFCVVLPGATADVAHAVAERMRKKVESPGFARVPVTASFGVSSIRFGAEGVPELIEQADAALYASKRGGRNRVTRFDRVPQA